MLPVTIWLILLFANTWIVFILHSRMPKTLPAVTTSKEKKRSVCGALSQANVTLWGSSGLFLFTQLPVLLLGQERESSLRYALADIEPVLILLQFLNYSVDFLVYSGMSAEYRHYIATKLLRVTLPTNVESPQRCRFRQLSCHLNRLSTSPKTLTVITD